MYEQINSDPKRRLKRFIWLSVIAFLVILFLTMSYLSIMFLDADFSMVRTGEIRWHLPKEFVQGKTDFVKIRLKYDTEIAEWEDLNTKDKLFADIIQTAEIMSLKLLSSKEDGNPHFKIEPNDYQEQVIDTSRLGENYWEWEITPLLSGEAELVLQQKIMIPTSEGLKDKQSPLKTQNVVIQKRLSYQLKTFFSNNLGWLMSAIIIPIWIYFYSNLKKTVKKKKEIDNLLKQELHLVNNSSLQKLKEKTVKFIQEDKVKEAIANIVEYSNLANTKELKNQISLISLSYESNEQNYRLNTISNSEYGINRSKTVKGLLLLITEISEYGTQQSI